jgi:hypothetical protein
VERDLQRRIAANEDTFRDVNDGIARGQWPGDEDVPVSFRCECARLGCNEMLTLSVTEYKQIRAHPRRFVVVARHQLPGVEEVVDAGRGYVVVEKLEEAGAETEARATTD